MKQLMQNLRSGETTVADVPIPTPQPGEALVRTATSLVSVGTERTLVEFAEKSLVGKARSRPDLVRQVINKARREGLLTSLEAAVNRLNQPSPLGYSSSGVVVALGEGVQGLKVGQRVACAGGNYAVHAEYACVPKILLTPLLDEVDFESAAFTTLGAIALHGFRLSEAQLGERVAVIGLGLLGLLMAGIANAAGCRVLGIDLDDKRVALAQSMGSKAVLRSEAEEAATSFSSGRGCDAILICADTHSADPVELAGAIARDRARVVAVGAVGLHIPRKIYYDKELTLINSRSYGPGRYDPNYEESGQDYPIGFVRWTEGRNMEAFVDLLASGRMDVRPLITHRFPIDQAPQAYELITGKRHEPFLGVLLTYPKPPDKALSELLPVYRAPDASTATSPDAGCVPTDTPLQQPDTRRVEGDTSIEAPGSVRLGVLGAGNFALAVMLPILKKVSAVELVGIASASGMSAKNAADRFGFGYATSDEAKIVADPEINTVAVLTRHDLHARQVLSALVYGKNVFCEKPLALTPQELDEIEAVLAKLKSRQGGSVPMLTVGFNRRFAPLAQRLAQFLAGRKEPLMAHYRVNAGYIPLSHWTQNPSQGGGRIIGEACHFIDLLTFLAGGAPVSVISKGLPDAGRYHEDNLTMTFTFPDGSLGTVIYLANGDKAFPKERLEVFAGGRVAVLDDFRSLELVQNGRRQKTVSRLRQDKGHQAEWIAFSQAIKSLSTPPIPYEQLIGVTRASFAAAQSLRCGEHVACAEIRSTAVDSG
jgi:predicted dehydrogenase/threonine dehydrogenase-like Zn-dependent dehydrogenase